MALPDRLARGMAARVLARRRRRRPAPASVPPPDQQPWRVVADVDRDRHYRLAVGTIYKDEAADLREWIEFHRLVGVEKFFLYDNNSTDDGDRVLAPYVESGLVTVHRFPPVGQQLLCYQSCVETYRDHARWIALIDVDEFLCPTAGDSVPDVLAGFEEHPALAVNWLMFSTSGHILRPPGLVTESYTACQAGGNRHVKLVVDPRRVESFETSHSARYRDGAKAVNGRGEVVDSMYSEPPVLDPIRINHYWTKSVEDFLVTRPARGYVDGVQARRDAAGVMMAERHYATGTDTSIGRFLPALRRALEG